MLFVTKRDQEANYRASLANIMAAKEGAAYKAINGVIFVLSDAEAQHMSGTQLGLELTKAMYVAKKLFSSVAAQSELQSGGIARAAYHKFMYTVRAIGPLDDAVMKVHPIALWNLGFKSPASMRKDLVNLDVIKLLKQGAETKIRTMYEAASETNWQDPEFRKTFGEAFMAMSKYAKAYLDGSARYFGNKNTLKVLRLHAKTVADLYNFAKAMTPDAARFLVNDTLQFQWREQYNEIASRIGDALSCADMHSRLHSQMLIIAPYLSESVVWDDPVSIGLYRYYESEYNKISGDLSLLIHTRLDAGDEKFIPYIFLKDEKWVSAQDVLTSEQKEQLRTIKQEKLAILNSMDPVFLALPPPPVTHEPSVAALPPPTALHESSEAALPPPLPPICGAALPPPLAPPAPVVSSAAAVPVRAKPIAKQLPASNATPMDELLSAIKKGKGLRLRAKPIAKQPPASSATPMDELLSAIKKGKGLRHVEETTGRQSAVSSSDDGLGAAIASAMDARREALSTSEDESSDTEEWDD